MLTFWHTVILSFTALRSLGAFLITCPNYSCFKMNDCNGSWSTYRQRKKEKERLKKLEKKNNSSKFCFSY